MDLNRIIILLEDPDKAISFIMRDGKDYSNT